MKKIDFIQPKLNTTILALIGLVILCYLGQWQLERLAWKTELLNKIAAQTAKPTAPLPNKVTNTSTSDWEYRDVTVAGEFLHEKEFYMQPRSLNNTLGGHIVTPFRRASGDIVLINRGWVAKGKTEDIARPMGIIQISAHVKKMPKKSFFMPENSPMKNEWYWTEKAKIEKHLDKKIMPLILYQNANEDKNYRPQAGQIRLDYPNNHLGYALFWFSLGLALIAMYVISHISTIKKKETLA